MAYIGREPTNTGEFLLIDDISSDFDGSEVNFTLQVGLLDITPAAANTVIALDGVLQEPTTAYSISGSTVTFTEAPDTGLSFYGVLAGQSQYISNSSITNEHINAATSISGSKISTDFGAQNIQITHITASGNISASGIVIADTFQSSGGSTDSISFTDDLNITGNITASGDISSSGAITADEITVDDADINVSLLVNKDQSATGDFRVKSQNRKFMIFSDANRDKVGIGYSGDPSGTLTSEFNVLGDIFTSGSAGHITASGDISASGNLYVTGHTDLDGSITIAGAVTASSNISASGNLSVTGNLDIDGTSNLASDLYVGGNITGSEMSASVSKFTTTTIDKLGGAIDFNNENMTNVDIDSGNIDAVTFGSTTKSMISGSRDAVSISGSRDAASISGSFGNQRVGTTDDVKFANITGSGNVSASGNLSITGNVDVDGTSNFAGDVTMQNDLVVTGKLTAEEIHTTFISSSIAQATGSNIFGDATTDSHHFTGSVDISGSLRVSDGNVVVSDTLTATNIGAFTAAGAIDFNNENMTNVDIDSGVITGITDLVVADGGTGVSTLTDGGVLLGNGAGAIQAMAVLTDGQMIVGDGTTDPVAESGATLRTSIGVGTTDNVLFANITGSNVSASVGKFTTATIDNITGNTTSSGDFGADGDLYVGGRITGSSGATFVGNVGIGTSSPSYALHVQSAQSDYGTIIGATEGALGALVQGSTANNIHAFIGNFKYNFASPGASVNLYGSAGEGIQMDGETGLRFYATPNATVDASFQPAERMTILAESGNVGIGIATPASDFGFQPLLHLKRDTDIAFILDNATEKFEFCMNNDSDHLRIGASSRNDILNLEASSGNVGIGTTSPARTLTVAGTIHSSGSDAAWSDAGWARYIDMGASAGGGGLIWRLQASGPSRAILNNHGTMYFARSTADDNSASPTYDMTILNDGNVGIGQATPQSDNSSARILHIGSSGDASTSIVIEDNERQWEIINNGNLNFMSGTTNMLGIRGDNGAATFSGALTAASYADNTPYPKSLDLAKAAVLSHQKLPDGQYDENDIDNQLDHSFLHEYVSGDEKSRNVSATVSCLVEVIKDLMIKVEALENA